MAGRQRNAGGRRNAGQAVDAKEKQQHTKQTKSPTAAIITITVVIIITYEDQGHDRPSREIENSGFITHGGDPTPPLLHTTATHCRRKAHGHTGVQFWESREATREGR